MPSINLRPSALLVGCGLLASTATTAAPSRPNLLFFAIDDLRPALGCYGDPQVKTPHIDRLAAQGLLLQRAYCQVPVCGASRASLMTGILPLPNRFMTHLARADEDAPGATTLPQVFKEAGYTTLANGKVFHNAADTRERSWSEAPWNSGQSHSTSLDPNTTATKSAAGRSRMYESPDVPDNAYGDEGEMLYDLVADPAENHNLAAQPAHQRDLTAMKALLAASKTTAASANVPPPRPSSRKKGADDTEK